MPLYTYVGPVAGSKAPTLRVSAVDLTLDPGDVVADLGGSQKTFKNGSTKAVKATTLANNQPAFVFVDAAGAAWLDDNPAGANIPGDLWRAGRVWRDVDGKLVVCQGDVHGNTVVYTAQGSPFSRRWIDDGTSAGGFAVADAPFQRSPSVVYQTLVAVTGGGTATLQVRNPKSTTVTKVGTFGGSTPIPTQITVGTEGDVLEFQTSDANTKVRVTIETATEKL